MMELQCTKCGTRLGENVPTKLTCTNCGEEYRIERGIPILLNGSALDSMKESMLSYYSNEAKVYNVSHGSSKYGTEYNYRKYYRNMFEKYITSDDRVLEIGGGTGRFSAIFEKMCGELCVTDISLDMLLNNNSATGRQVCADTEYIPFPDNSFDCCIGMTTFSYVPNKKRAMAEIFRVLKPGGRLLIIDQHAKSILKSIAKLYYYKHRQNNRISPVDDSTPDTLKRLFVESGFDVQDEGVISFIPHALPWPIVQCLRPMNWILENIPSTRKHGMRLFIGGACKK